MQRLIDDFLAQKRIAIVGVTRDPNGWGRRLYDAFKERGYDVYAVNPNASSVQGIQCYTDLKQLPMKPDGVLLAVPPSVTDQVVREVAALNIPRVWMHRGGGPGAVSQSAIEFCQANNIAVVYGVCPFMYLQPQAFGHKLHYNIARWLNILPGGA
jgi:uncharacterized protein